MLNQLTMSAAAIAVAAAAYSQHEEQTFDVSFAGGTVAEYAEVLRDTPGNANIIVMPDAASIELPELEMRSVDIYSAMELLEGQYESPGIKRVLSISNHHGVVDGAETIFVVNAKVSRSRGHLSDEETGAVVMSIEHLIDPSSMPAEDVLTSIEFAMAMIDGDDGSSEIRFHAPTSLLIVRGRGTQLSTVSQVIDQLEQTAHNRDRDQQQRREASENEAANYQARMADLQQQNADMSHALEAAEMRYRMLRTELDQIRNQQNAAAQRYEQRILELREQAFVYEQQLRALEGQDE